MDQRFLDSKETKNLIDAICKLNKHISVILENTGAFHNGESD